MNIVHIITRFINGGADENTLYSCNWAAERGHTVTLVHGGASKGEILSKLHPNVRVESIPALIRSISPIKDFSALVAIRKILKTTRPDIVHTHTSKAGIIGRIAAKLENVPAIIHGVHIAPFVNVGNLERISYVFLERLAARWTDAFINVSEGMQAACLKEGIGTAANHIVIHSGMALERFIKATPPDNWREILNVEPDAPKPPTVLMLAALEERKRHIPLLEAFETVFAELPETRLLFGGDGPDRNVVEAASAKSPHAANVKFLGFYPDPASLIALADVSVLCSTREGLPRVVVQYIAGGCPPVVSDLPGISEILTSGVEGFVTSPTDVAEVAKRILQLLQDDKLLKEMQLACRSRDLSSWTFENMCLMQDEVYAAVLGKQKLATAKAAEPFTQ